MKSLVGFVVTILLLCTSVVFAQSNQSSLPGYPALGEVSYAYQGGSARAMGMGYAFVGLSNDVSSGIWNPAGLWILEGPIISASYNMYTPATEFRADMTPAVTKSNLDMNAVGHFSFVAPVRIKGHPWVFTANFNRNNEFSDNAATLSDPENKLDPDTFVEDNGNLQFFNAGASTRIYKQFSMGFTVNVIDARRVIDRNRLTSVDTIINPVIGSTAEKYTTDQLLDSTKSNGFNFTIGMMLKGEKYSAGAVIQTPYTMKHSTDRSHFVETRLNGLIQVENTSTIFVVDSLAKQEVPLSMTFGVGLFPRENLTLTMDVSFQNYGSTNWFYLDSTFFAPNGERTEYYTEIPIDWNNNAGLGVGLEYLLNTKYGRVPLRAGFRYDQLPQPAVVNQTTSNVGYNDGTPYELNLATVTRTASDRQKATSFSLGSGIGWSRIELDFAYMYTGGAKLEYTQTNISYGEDDEGNPVANSESIKQEWDRKSHEFRITFTGFF